VLAEPDRFWTPADLLDFSRRHQRPVGRPGERFAYSDTGYILLGRVLEQATGRAFHELLHERILTPLGMRDTALLFYSVPTNDPRRARPDITGRRTPRSRRRGAPDRAVPPRPARGQHAPQRELRLGGRRHRLHSRRPVRFSAALHRGELIAPASLSYLAEPRNRFRSGIRYGAGTMEVRFEGFMPLLRGMPRPVGHIGILATHLFHDPVHDADIVLNFASTREMVRSFRTLIAIERG
jgi:D-alanyl-D-alanine carboxypeptidase